MRESKKLLTQTLGSKTKMRRLDYGNPTDETGKFIKRFKENFKESIGRKVKYEMIMRSIDAKYNHPSLRKREAESKMTWFNSMMSRQKSYGTNFNFIEALAKVAEH